MEKRPQNDLKMQNLSQFVAKIEKIMENESLQHISTPQYTFMPHRPLKTVFNHNIHCYHPSNDDLLINLRIDIY